MGRSKIFCDFADVLLMSGSFEFCCVAVTTTFSAYVLACSITAGWCLFWLCMLSVRMYRLSTNMSDWSPCLSYTDMSVWRCRWYFSRQSTRLYCELAVQSQLKRKSIGNGGSCLLHGSMPSSLAYGTWAGKTSQMLILQLPVSYICRILTVAMSMHGRVSLRLRYEEIYARDDLFI